MSEAGIGGARAARPFARAALARLGRRLRRRPRARPSRPCSAMGVAAGAAARLAARRAPRLAAVAAVLLLLGVAVGQLGLAGNRRAREARPRRRRVRLRATLLTPPRPGLFGDSAEVHVRGGPLDGARLLARTPRWQPFPTTDVGAELGPRRRPRAPAFGRRLRRLPAQARGGAASWRSTTAGPPAAGAAGVAGVLDGMRRRADRAVAAGLSDREAALLRGMVLGEDEQIDEATRDDWRAPASRTCSRSAART